ncbi:MULTISPECIES: class I SAM-dependent DNA methyltransferase [unclassified Pseudodesulfovibrio]|uniref:type I restriction-modification system subunit M n=1 Tax=unclassified Pseudodesulfovibrio TaxID=2661612 RepID=UPI000FEBB16B|nr:MULTISPECIES: class I SAM-dependent DNA methyltransferase [unclassified Pseudodesulfovibrio]MCJ2165235.1 type I restriction-modification system subunit M [Pseudodesulfovibrio sp. S3-i]RWU03289.1 SAM-dependent DNA methyltransferase [Pseudodesulfovibrio sp. S3]
MVTGTLKSKIDNVWNAFWSGGVTNPLTVIEQISYLLFIRRLDEMHTAKEMQASILGGEIKNPIFTGDQEEFRWSALRDKAPAEMFDIMIRPEGLFQFIKTMNGNGTAYARFMKDAVFVIPNAGLLSKVVDLIDDIPMDDRDTKGDLYEYLLSKLTTAGVNGQFRTPRHIIKMMVEMLEPTPEDTICDPACGTAGFLMAAGEYMRETHPELFQDDRLRKHFNGTMFAGFDFDSSMLRIAVMNMVLHGVENPHIEARDSLTQESEGISGICTKLYANPPFKGSLDNDIVASDLLKPVSSKKTELLFINLFLRLLKIGGRCACIVPDGVLFGSTKAHMAIRKRLVDEQKLDAVISMPSGVFKPYAGVSTAILIFTKTDSGGTDNVWFYDMRADGFSLDDKRTPLTGGKHENDNIPDILTRWKSLVTEAERARTEQSFLVPHEEIAGNKYDLSINRYKELVYAEEKYDPPREILGRMKELEREILADLDELEGMLG